MKISYMAAQKTLSITELFVQAMIKTFRVFYKPKNEDEKMLWSEQIEEKNNLNLNLHHIMSAKLKNLVSYGAAFAMNDLGIAALIIIKDRLRYNRILYERYL